VTTPVSSYIWQSEIEGGSWQAVSDQFQALYAYLGVALGSTATPTGQRLGSDQRTSLPVHGPAGVLNAFGVCQDTPSAPSPHIAHFFAIRSATALPAAGPQALEGYALVEHASGTTALAIGTIGNMEIAAQGATTLARAVQAGVIITSTGGGTDAACFDAEPAGRAFGGSGTFTNGYGLKVGTFGAGFGNKYSVHCADTSAVALLGGGVTLSVDNANKPTSNTWTIVSDARLKEQIADFLDGLDVVKRLRPVSYILNGKGGQIAGAKGISLIAQEAEPVVPYCVSERTHEGETFKTLDTSALTHVLINAVKELSAQVESLTARVAALEAV
jgi:Chaperone of endosialidase